MPPSPRAANTTRTKNRVPAATSLSPHIPPKLSPTESLRKHLSPMIETCSPAHLIRGRARARHYDQWGHLEDPSARLVFRGAAGRDMAVVKQASASAPLFAPRCAAISLGAPAQRQPAPSLIFSLSRRARSLASLFIRLFFARARIYTYMLLSCAPRAFAFFMGAGVIAPALFFFYAREPREFVEPLRTRARSSGWNFWRVTRGSRELWDLCGDDWFYRG